MRRTIITMCVVVGLALAGCSGGSSSNAKDGAQCSSEGATAGTNPVLECQRGVDGRLAWHSAGGQQVRNLAESLGKCDAASTINSFSSGIVDAATIDYIYPLGAMTTTHITPVDHIYVYFPNASAPDRGAVSAGSYLVTAPADGQVVAVEDFRKSNQYPSPDYRIVISHSCNLYSVFIHVGELQGALKAALASPSGSTMAPNVSVKAGEVLADDSANPGFDFSVFDGTKKIALANEASYSQAETWKPYTAQPFPFFPELIRSQYQEKSLRTSSPFDGRIDWDKMGTARGSWFVNNTNGYRGKGDQGASYSNHDKVAHGYWDTHLALAPDPVDNAAFIYSIGDFAGCPCQFMAKNNLDPATVTSSSSPTVVELVDFSAVTTTGAAMNFAQPTKGYKLQPGSVVAGLLAFQLNADGSMTVEKMPGATSAAMFNGFTSAAQTYVR